MADHSNNEIVLCSTCNAFRRTFVGKFNESDRDSVCCAHCGRFIRWYVESEMTKIVLDISPAAYAEIRARLQVVGDVRAFKVGSTEIDLTGLTIRPTGPEEPEKNFSLPEDKK